MSTSGDTIDRRKFLKASGVAGAGLLAGCVGDDDPEEPTADDDNDHDDGEADETDVDFPQSDIQIIIPYGPGGGYDTYARLLAPHLGEQFDVEILPQNVEGAGGIIGTEQVYNANDAHEVLIANVSDFAINQIQDDVEYDLAEMTWLAQIAEDLRGIGVANHTGITTFEEYVEAVQNEELNFYSPGPGAGQVIVPVVLGEVSGLYPAENVTDNVVTYDGRGEAYQGMLAGDVDVMAGTYNSVLPFTEDEDEPVEMIMALNTDDEPPEPTPDADTLATADVDNAEEIQDTVTGRRAFAAPPETDDAVREILADAFDAAINDDEFRAEAEEAERPIAYMGSEDTERAVVNMVEEWENDPEMLDAVFY